MALETAFYLVTKEVAMRSGLINTRYRVKDGRFVLNNKDLARVRLTPAEFINGLQGAEMVDEEEARTLIARNGFQMGEQKEQPQPIIQPNAEEEPVVEQSDIEALGMEDIGDIESVVNNNEQDEEE